MPALHPQIYQERRVIRYVALPTAREFHASTAFVRGVMGPLGSGKSAMCTWEMFERVKGQKAHNGVRRSRWAIIRSCYDDETEILTEKRGFQLFRNLRETDRVPTLQSGKIVYELPESVSVFPYEGDMIGFEGEQVDFLVTPDHKLWASKRRTRKLVWGEYEQVEAQDIYGSRLWRVKRNAEWDSGFSEFNPAVYEWLGFYFAEGSYWRNQHRARCIITQCTASGIEYARDLFRRASLSYFESMRVDGGINFILKKCGVRSGKNSLGRNMMSIIRCAGHAIDKRIPQRIMRASRPSLLAFLAGFERGDGGLSGSGRTRQLYTSSKRLADQLQEIALKAGYVANVAFRDRTGRPVMNGTGRVNAPEWTITLCHRCRYHPILHAQKDIRFPNNQRGWYKQYYKGNVYCVKMPQPIVYVRRRGKAHWNTRTYPELHLTTLSTFLDWIPEMEVPGYSLTLNRQPPMQAHLRMKLEDGTRVEADFIFLALATDEDIKKLKSFELTGVWINEATEIPFACFNMARGRVRRYPSPRDGGYSWSGVIMDTNPCEEGEDSWWYRLAEIEQPENYQFWKQPPALLRIPKKNPKDPHEPQLYMPNTGQGAYPPAENVENHTEGFRYWMDLTAGASQDWISVFLMGQYGSVQEGKPVYSEYFDEVHLARDEAGEPMDLEIMRGLPLVIGLDFGITPCCIFAQQTPNGVMRVIDELVSNDMGIRQFARDLLKPHLQNVYYNMPRVMIGDPAGNQRTQANDEVSCLQELANAGLPTEMARTNAFLPRREAVAGYMTRMVNGKAGFQLSAKCRVLRAGFKGKYQYRKMRTTAGDAYSVEPMKNHPYSDVQDALQYACMYCESGGISGKANPDVRGSGTARPVKKHSSAGWD